MLSLTSWLPTRNRFKLALKESNYGDDELTSIFSSIDVNENGHIVYTEFLAATLGVKGSIEEERVAEAFDRLDSDDSGFISPVSTSMRRNFDAATVY